MHGSDRTHLGSFFSYRAASSQNLQCSGALDWLSHNILYINGQLERVMRHKGNRLFAKGGRLDPILIVTNSRDFLIAGLSLHFLTRLFIYIIARV